MGLILDLAVAALALAVIGSLTTLAWTLAVSAVRADARGRRQVAQLRRSVDDAEARLPGYSARIDAALREGIRRTATPDRFSPGDDPAA